MLHRPALSPFAFRALGPALALLLAGCDHGSFGSSDDRFTREYVWREQVDF